MTRPFIKTLVCAALAFCGSAMAAEWQWSVQVDPAPSTQPYEKQEHSRAFLWLPRDCKQVRGVVFAHHNMEEEAILEHPKFRAAMAELGFAAVWVAPTFDRNFRFDQGAGERFDRMMAALASESGYGELTFAPLVPMGHSAAASMPWYMAAWKPERIIAGMSVSGQWPYVPDEPNAPHVTGISIDGVPGLVTLGEYEWADTRLRDGTQLRSQHPKLPLSGLGVPADGHFAALDEKIDFLSLYLRKAVQYRLPKESPADRAPVLIGIDPTKTGWLADRWRLNKEPLAPPAPVDKYRGDPAQAFWWFDEELAHAAAAFQAKQRGKAVLLGYKQDGEIVPQVNGTHQQVTLKFLPGDDGVTFQLVPTFLDTVPEGRPEKWTGKKAGEPIERPSGETPIRIERITGPVKKLTATTWRLDLNRASLLNDRRGNEAWLVAIWPGDGAYKRAVQQAVIRIPRRNDKGAEQTITFPKPGDVKPSTRRAKLSATASSGLKVRYFVREGPAEVDDEGNLTLLAIPPRAKFPVKVTVVAWQWGRANEPRVKTAIEVEQTINIVAP